MPLWMLGRERGEEGDEISCMYDGRYASYGLGSTSNIIREGKSKRLDGRLWREDSKIVFMRLTLALTFLEKVIRCLWMMIRVGLSPIGHRTRDLPHIVDLLQRAYTYFFPFRPPSSPVCFLPQRVNMQELPWPSLIEPLIMSKVVDWTGYMRGA